MARTRRKRRHEIKRVPRTDATLPEHDRSAVPDGLITRRQLRDLNLSPGGHDPVAVLRCKGCAYQPEWSCTHPTRGWLYRVDLAQPKRTPTLAQERALDRAMAARQTCPECKRRYHFCLPLRTQGCCNACNTGREPTPGTYIDPPAKHLLAA
ncbi:RRQRL motif-containing zinc-binding protein [Streptomyces antimycoticus]|uniref:RRQRL motif-containing zinc-binding protein n=1 Tax=Streptomyces antimycoticus TaxID=68175 RepID=UPI00191BA851|nr:RRQRL motif-containing zinc-binding protein [Streptomyces antimycoticus]